MLHKLGILDKITIYVITSIWVLFATTDDSQFKVVNEGVKAFKSKKNRDDTKNPNDFIWGTYGEMEVIIVDNQGKVEDFLARKEGAWV